MFEVKVIAEAGIPVERYVPFPTDYKFVLANNYKTYDLRSFAFKKN